MIEEKEISSYFKQINNNLILNTSFLTNIGLFNGKMGICIYFFLLAKKIRNPIFNDYAEELIDEVYSEITIDTPIDFADGLAGIGWAIEYLVQNGFVEADTDEILEDFDNKLIYEVSSLTEKEEDMNKTIGLGYYFLSRIKNKKDSKSTRVQSNAGTLQNILQLLIKTIDKEGLPEINIQNFEADHILFKLLFFLSEIRLNIPDNTESNQLLRNLLDSNITNFKYNQSTGLLLSMIFQRVKRSGYTNLVLDQFLSKQISESPIRAAETELKSQPKTLQKGIPGVFMSQYLLYKTSPTENLKDEIINLYENFLLFLKTEPEYMETFLSSVEENRIYGLLRGIAGLGLTHLSYMELKEK